MDHTTSTDGQSPNAHKDKDFFTALPNELLTQITKQLPPREICRLRGQNRHMRNFIDENEHLLVKDVITYHRNRIHTEYQLLTDLADCDVTDVLHRYCSHYGELGGYATRKTRAVNAALRSNWNRVKDTKLSTSHLLFYFYLIRQTSNLCLRRITGLYSGLASATRPKSAHENEDMFRERFESTPWADHAAYPENSSLSRVAVLRMALLVRTLKIGIVTRIAGKVLRKRWQ